MPAMCIPDAVRNPGRRGDEISPVEMTKITPRPTSFTTSAAVRFQK